MGSLGVTGVKKLLLQKCYQLLHVLRSMVMWLMHIVNLKFLHKSYGLKKMSGVIWGQEVKYKGQISNNVKWRN